MPALGIRKGQPRRHETGHGLRRASGCDLMLVAHSRGQGTAKAG